MCVCTIMCKEPENYVNSGGTLAGLRNILTLVAQVLGRGVSIIATCVLARAPCVQLTLWGAVACPAVEAGPSAPQVISLTHSRACVVETTAVRKRR